MNYYEVLDIGRDADGNEIKRAYFKAVKQHSPDSDPEGFKAIRIAYETLSDQKKRAAYDAYFAAPSDIQNDLLAARELMRQNQYKQAVEFLTDLDATHPASADIRRLLAEALWFMKKSGTAETICKVLLEENPSDCDTMLLRARIAASRGHTTKAEEYFFQATEISPLSPNVWIQFLRFLMQHSPWRVQNVLALAMKSSPDIFREDYIFYLVGTQGVRMNFSHEDSIKYIEKFAEFFIADKNPDEDTYKAILSLLPRISENDEAIPSLEKILPALERCRYCSEEDGEVFRRIRANIAAGRIKADKRIDDVFAELTSILLDNNFDIAEKLEIECYIVSELPEIRSSIKILRKDYPEYFSLHQEFYLFALNEKKTDFLVNKYYPIYKRLKRGENPSEEDESFDDELINLGRPQTYVRETPKIGRNDPCPCGSGKKYKKCCG